MCIFIARLKGSKNRFLEGFHHGRISNFLSIKSNGWINFDSVVDVREYFSYMTDTLNEIKKEHVEKEKAVNSALKSLCHFEILEIKNKEIVNIIAIDA